MHNATHNTGPVTNRSAVRITHADISEALATGDLRSLAPRDVATWRRGRIAAAIVRGGAR